MFSYFVAQQSPSSLSFRSSSDTLNQKYESLADESHYPLEDKLFPDVSILSRRKLHPAFDIMKWLCVGSHIGLIVFLASFTFKQPDKTNSGYIYFSKPSFQIDDNTEHGKLIQTIIKQGFGWVITGWTIILTLTTQRLALRRQLNLYNSLTAKHDANEAWMGFGSAILTSLNWRQLGFRVSMNSIFLPLLYLGGIASLHSVAVAMFGLVPQATTKTISFTSSGIPNFTGTDVGNIWTGSTALLTMASLDGIPFPGLASNGSAVIYDIPDPANISNVPSDVLVQVKATRFDVSCGSVSGTVSSTESGTNFIFSSNMGVPASQIYEFPTVISQRGLFIRPAPWGAILNDLNDPKAYWPSSIFIVSTVNISDSFNNTVEMVPVDSPMTYSKFTSPQTVTSPQTGITSHVAALACNLTIDQLSNNASIHPSDNNLVQLLGRGNKTSAQLSPFPVSTRPLLSLNEAEDALISTWSSLSVLSTSPMNDQLRNWCLENNNDSSTTCGTLFETEQFVMESLGIYPDLMLPANLPSTPIIQLKDLENVLARMTAIEFWAEGHGSNLNFANKFETSTYFAETGVRTSTEKAFVKNQNTAQVPETRLAFAIQLSDLYAAIAISVLLLVLAMPSLLDNNNLKIDSIGILQMIWLANDHPELQQSIIKLKDPSIHDLRREGIFIQRNFHRHAMDEPLQPC
ncbi:hypothetical protein GYMLUDRAFT_36339 [Collybiopsis luxurians FD-317 M1]|nr:hypothetical protein GYMLUDRAFT_36339 [Collybiopsis luxurians FD-317 M1]